MSSSSGSVSADVRRKKQTVGVVAIAFVVLFLVLFFFGIFNIIVFVIADLIVGLAANYIFRRLDRQSNR
ncbi:MAG TPA: hypothetical protein VLV84_06265 [Candidatus Acidoferrales bacterium]|nr:hypothetical protein [Candidatus Acidoferrales bacterium]